MLRFLEDGRALQSLTHGASRSYPAANEYRMSRSNAHVRQGLLGKIDGAMMAHSNRRCVVWVIADVLRIQANESILEVGFGPGVGIECLVKAGAGMSIESG